MENRKKTDGSEKETRSWKRNKVVLLWILLIIFIIISSFTHLDKKIIAAIIVLYGLVTPVFAGIISFISSCVGLIPFIGPHIIRIFALPATALVSLMAYIFTLFKIKEGRIKDVALAKVCAISLTIGIIIGYILGKIF